MNKKETFRNTKFVREEIKDMFPWFKIDSCWIYNEARWV